MVIISDDRTLQWRNLFEEGQEYSRDCGGAEDGITSGICTLDGDDWKYMGKILVHASGREINIHLMRSQLRWRTPLKEWNANGAARIAFPAYLTPSGRPEMTSMMWALSKTPGAMRYDIENP